MYKEGPIFELVALFVLIPLILVLGIKVWIKISIVLIALIYVGVIGKESILSKLNWTIEFKDWRRILSLWLSMAIVSSILCYYFLPENLFRTVLNKPLLWILIVFIYTVFSVIPQEVIYRKFFFDRYTHLFRDTTVLFVVNAFLFSLAHLFLWNAIVLVLTFFGGLLFSYTYNKTRSLMTAIIEHGLYGLWLFTIGAGEMLAFPS